MIYIQSENRNVELQAKNELKVSSKITIASPILFIPAQPSNGLEIQYL